MSASYKELANLRRQQQFLYLAIFSLVMAMITIAYSLFSSQQRTQISPELKKLAQPLNPAINQDVLTQIEEKRQFTQEELRLFPIYKSIQIEDGGEMVVPIEEGWDTNPSASASSGISLPTQTPTPSPSLAPSPTPQSSPSGTIVN